MAPITAFESTLHTTHEWLNELCNELGRDDTQQAYRILRAVLLALRDRLTVEEATDLGAQLPMLVRGIYYEGFNPSKTPTRERNVESFLAHVSEGLADMADGAPETATRSVFKLLDRHLTAGAVQHAKGNLPSQLQTLWP